MKPNQHPHHRLLSVKELAAELRRHDSYVYKMRAQGFRMPGGTATVAEARAWLEQHPHPRARRKVATTPRPE